MGGFCSFALAKFAESDSRTQCPMQYLVHCTIQYARDQFLRVNKVGVDGAYADGALFHLLTYCGVSILPIMQWRAPFILGGLNYSLGKLLLFHLALCVKPFSLFAPPKLKSSSRSLPSLHLHTLPQSRHHCHRDDQRG